MGRHKLRTRTQLYFIDGNLNAQNTVMKSWGSLWGPFFKTFFGGTFYPFFSLISWYPIGSYSFVPSLQLPHGLGRGEGWECATRTWPRQATLLLDTLLA
jgi:hypothetical protein